MSIYRGLKHVRTIRNFSSVVRISPEVKDALASKKPVVALESTIMTHGLPYPGNLKMAKSVETIIRKNGAIPATTGFINGVPTVGLTDEHLEYLCSTPNLVKVSRRDIPVVMNRKLGGGTTIAGTMILAHLAGIKVFATGGLGGVHRGGEITMDVSADLDELARTPVGVVCSGPKSILDIEKTMEYLETKGVLVSTYGKPGTNVPGFFTADSGVPSPYNFQTAEEAAELLHANEQMKLNNGTVFCVPAPDELCMPKALMDSVIEQAVLDADREGIKGKGVTPFLLNRIWQATKGDSLVTNVGFVENNAAIGARIACHLAELEANTISRPSSGIVRQTSATVSSLEVNGKGTDVSKIPADLIVVGTIAIDMTCRLRSHGEDVLYTSTPGVVETTLGGVGHNVALAATYRGQTHGIKVRLVTQIGADVAQSTMDALKNSTPEFDQIGIHVVEGAPTARYIALHDDKGGLVAACADMDQAGKIDNGFIKSQILASKPRVVVFDGNIDTSQKTSVLHAAKASGALTAFEPTSVSKAAKLGELALTTYPNHMIDICTPNEFELGAIYNALKDNNFFDTDNWFPVIDALRINEDFRLSLENLAQTIPDLKNMNTSGLAQQAFHLLPYIPSLFIKSGKKGVLAIQLIQNIQQLRIAQNLRTSSGHKVSTRICKGNGDVGILLQHFPAEKVDESTIVSVTGAGDTFCGIIASEVANDSIWLHEAGQSKLTVIDLAQRAAALTIQSQYAVSPEIKQL